MLDTTSDEVIGEEGENDSGASSLPRGALVLNEWVSELLAPSDVLALQKQKVDIGYRLVTLYTACVTAYVALVGVTAKFAVDQFFAGHRQLAFIVAMVGLALGICSVLGGFGLFAVLTRVEAEINGYRDALCIPRRESLLIVRVGALLSIALFICICGAWLYVAILAA